MTTYMITDRGLRIVRNPKSPIYEGVSPEALKILDEVLDELVPKSALIIAYEKSENLTSAEAQADFERKRKELGAV